MTEQPKPENLSDGVKSEQEAYLHAVEATMSEFFAQQRTLLTAISQDALPLLEAIESLSSGGKRLRALLRMARCWRRLHTRKGGSYPYSSSRGCP